MSKQRGSLIPGLVSILVGLVPACHVAEPAVPPLPEAPAAPTVQPGFPEGYTMPAPAAVDGLPLPDMSTCSVLRNLKPKHPFQFAHGRLPAQEPSGYATIGSSSGGGERGEQVLQAARKAAAKGALVEAVRLATEALREVRGVDRVVVAAFLGSVEFDTADYARAVDHLAEAYLLLRRSDRFYDSRSDFDGRFAALAEDLPIALAEAYVVLGKVTKGRAFFAEEIETLEAARAKANRRDQALALDLRLLGLKKCLAKLEPDAREREELWTEVFEAAGRLLGEPPLDEVGTYALASAVWNAGDRPRASAIGECACAIGVKKAKDAEPATAAAAGTCYMMKAGYADDAPREALLRAAVARLTAGGQPDLAGGARVSLADVLRKAGRLDDALEQLGKANRRAPASRASVLRRTAQIAWAKGDLDRARASLSELVDARDKILSGALWSSDDAEKRRAMKDAMDDLETVLAFHSANKADSAGTSLAVSAVVRLKGRALDASINFAQSQKSGDPRAQLMAARMTLRRRLTAAPSANADEAKKLVEDARQRVKLLEATYSPALAEADNALESVQTSQVQATLPPGSLLLEITSFRPYDPVRDTWGEARYVGFAIPKSGAAKSVDLGLVSAADQRVTALRRAILDQSTSVVQVARDAAKVVWDPLVAAIGDAKHVLIAPDGNLALLPFAALVEADGHYLVESRTLSYVTTPGSLVAPAALPRSPAVIVANPAFDSDVVDSRDEEGDAGSVSLPDAVASRLAALPGTKSEAARVKAELRKATVFSEAKATEAALRDVHGPEVLHIATHGFFLADSARAGKDARGLELDDSEAPGDNPMLRVGLLLAGARHKGKYGQRGLLSAMEASQLDLSGTKLVTLSACQTGVGDVAQGDGVYSLRRAFEIAGAQSVVASLWSVDDTSTRDLMAAFYGLLRKSTPSAQALQKAQQAVSKSKKFGHPYHWAAFTLSGRSGSLR